MCAKNFVQKMFHEEKKLFYDNYCAIICHFETFDFDVALIISCKCIKVN